MGRFITLQVITLLIITLLIIQRGATSTISTHEPKIWPLPSSTGIAIPRVSVTTSTRLRLTVRCPSA